MRSFYLAAKYDKRPSLLPIAALLMLAGHRVTSTWLNGTHDGTLLVESMRYAKLDLAHIQACTHFVLFNLPIDDPEQSSGRNVEFGYAMALGKFLITVGKGNCIFYTQADAHYPSISAFLEAYAPGSKI